MRIQFARPAADPDCPPNARLELAGRLILDIFDKVQIGTIFEVLGIVCIDRDKYSFKKSPSERIEYLIRSPKSNFPIWVSYWFFDVIDKSIPPDWIIDSWSGEQFSATITLVMGPKYFAGGTRDFSNFENSEPEQKKAYHEHLKSLGLYIIPDSEDATLQKLKKLWK